MSKAATKIMDDVTTELPEGWRMATIGELLKVRNGYAFSNKDYTESGALLVRQSNLGGDTVSMRKAKYLPARYLAEHPEYQVHKGDILIGMSGSIGKLCTYDLDEPALQNQRTGLLVFQDEDQKRWVWYYLPLLEQGLKEISKGVAVQNVSAKQIESFSIPVAPPEDQRRIVAEIEKQFSRLDEAVTSLKRVKANLKRYKAAVLKAAVEGKLTEEWRQQNPDVEPASKLLERILAERRTKWEEAELAKMKAKGKEPKDDKWKEKYKEPLRAEGSSDLPEGWVWSSVNQIAEVQLGKMLDKKKHTKGVKKPYLRNINVRWGSVDTNDCSEMFFQDHELDRYGLEEGDVLVCEGGEPGRAAIWGARLPDMKYQKALHRVRLSKGINAELLVIYLEYLGKSGRLERWFTGTTIKHFTRESFSSLPFPLAPEDEQKQVNDEIDQRIFILQGLENQISADLKRAERVRQSILANAFSGGSSEVTSGK